ncbi:MAG: hypothetical protein U0231_14385 [Nitrospiraceae bacterium]
MQVVRFMEGTKRGICRSVGKEQKARMSKQFDAGPAGNMPGGAGQRIGLIAGNGRFPIIFAENARKLGYAVLRSPMKAKPNRVEAACRAHPLIKSASSTN